jgi:nitrate reductase gamma subunit
MTLLDFARGPALQWALIIFLVGVSYRMLAIFMFARKKPLSVARGNATIAGYKTIFSRARPHAVFRKRLGIHYAVGMVWHVGFLMVLVLFQPHILFFEGLLGVSWPGIANNLVMPIAGVTLVLLVVAFVRRLTDPVLKLLSGPGDLLTIVVTALPLITGLLASAHLGARYETMLALHLLTISLLLVWLPFSKLMHAVLFIPSRKRLGAKLGYKGVKA